ncbi:sugar transferase [bacterium]|nr:sugar transferase [bacterium]
MGFFSETEMMPLLQLSFLVYLFWLTVFGFFGLYNTTHARSRIDEVITIVKTTILGVLLIFLVTFDLEKDISSRPQLSRMFIINYFFMLLIFVTLTRTLFRSFQRALLNAGIGHRRTLIVGWGEEGKKLSDQIEQFPALGYQVVGFVNDMPRLEVKATQYKNLRLLGNIDNLNQIAHDVKAQEVIFAVQDHSRKKVMDIMDQCNGMPVNFKIVPDLYDIVMGQARTNQIYGLPLIDIMPQLMPAWERRVKRLLDISISALILVLFAPFWILVAVAIKADSQGSVLYKQMRIGKDERPFTIYKFRSMIHRAESQTGPRWAKKRDPRITRVGRVLRTLHLDEVPQFINVLKGEMSLVGPRPERAHFVEKFKRQIPFYARRLKVQPGITGWAQVKGDYDTSIENVKTKLQYDLFYLENMSLKMDLKILINTIYVMLMGKGH